jgi:polyribonucleotide nucleotidyltransferase
MDIKVPGIGEEVVKAAMNQAREGINHILGEMRAKSGLSHPREDLSPYAPKLVQVMIDPDKIGLLIGPQGKTVKGIQERTETTVEIEEDGRVTISGSTTENVLAAKREVEQLTQEAEVGKVYEGTVTSVRDFGAFVEIFRGKEGLLHVSELSNDYVESVSSVVKVGDTIAVKVISIDDQDRIRLSHKATLPETQSSGSNDEKGNDRRHGEDRRSSPRGNRRRSDDRRRNRDSQDNRRAPGAGRDDNSREGRRSEHNETRNEPDRG